MPRRRTPKERARKQVPPPPSAGEDGALWRRMGTRQRKQTTQSTGSPRDVYLCLAPASARWELLRKNRGECSGHTRGSEQRGGLASCPEWSPEEPATGHAHGRSTSPRRYPASVLHTGSAKGARGLAGLQCAASVFCIREAVWSPHRGWRPTFGTRRQSN